MWKPLKHKRRHRGLTLLEVIVAAAVMAIISLVMLRAYMGAKTAFDFGSNQTAMHHKGRETMSKIVPQLMTAIPGNADNAIIYANDAVIVPSTAAGTSTQIVFTSTESLLTTDNNCTVHGVPHNTTFEQEIAAGGAVYKNYRIWFDNGGDIDPINNQVILEEVGNAGGGAGIPATAVDPSPRVLVSSNDEASVTNVTFEKLADGDVEVVLTIQGDRRNAQRVTQTVTETFETIVQLPHFSTK